MTTLPPKPIPPLPADCCDSGCTTCVWTVYDEELQRWNDAVRALREAAPIDSQPPPVDGWRTRPHGTP